MPSVTRDNISDQLWGSWPETAPAPSPGTSSESSSSAAAATKETCVPSNVVERRDDAEPWGDDSKFEASTRFTIANLRPDNSVLLTVKAELKEGESVGFETEAKVERQKDGSVIVELSGKADVGGGETLGSVRVGVAAGTKFHFDTAAQAADFLDSFAKEGVLVATHLDFAADTARACGVKGDVVDARERLLGHLANISEIKGDLVATAELGTKEKLFGYSELSASADLQAKLGFKIDLEKGTFTKTTSIALGGKAKLKLSFIDEAAGAKGTLSTNNTWKLNSTELRDLKAGRLSPDELMNKLRGEPTEVSVKCELELTLKAAKGGVSDAKGKLSVEYPLDTRKLDSLDPRAMLNELTRRRWKAELDVGDGVGLGGKLEAKGVSGEVSSSFRHKEKFGGEYDLNAAISALTERAAETSASQDLVDARRATANLR